MRHLLQIIIAVLFISVLHSCKKHYPPRPVLAEDQRSKEVKEPLLQNEMLETEGLRFNIDFPGGTADMSFKLFKASPNRSEIRLGIFQNSRDYYILSKNLPINTEYILSVEYGDVTKAGAFHLSITGIESLKGPAGLNLPSVPYTVESTGSRREILRIRKGNLKFAFHSL